MVTVKRFLSTVFICFLLLITTVNGWAQGNGSIGIVLLHGKSGTPSGHIAKLAEALRGEGYEVSTPTMPWASGLIYSASYADCLKLIGNEVASLRAKGIKTILVGGHSLGAHMALAYAGTDSTLAGVILLAPGHFPEVYASKRKPVLDSVESAKELVAQGSDKRIYFNDMNNGEDITVLSKPADYLSFCDPEGPCRLSNTMKSFLHSLPVLLVSEVSPKMDVKGFIFDELPQNKKSRFVQTGAAHVDVPDVSIAEVLSWLQTLSL